MALKLCSNKNNCAGGGLQPTTAFGKHKNGRSGLRSKCKKCDIVQTTAYNKKNPRVKRDIHFRHRYGITIDIYDAMVEQQNHRCAICLTHQTKLIKQLHLDHSHKNGKVRGLLCEPCNHGLGRFRDDILIMTMAIDYLKAHT